MSSNFRVESESKQCQTELTDLRSANKVSDQDKESIIAERDELKRKFDMQINETQRISRLLSQSSEEAMKCQGYEKENQMLKDSIANLERELTFEKQEKSMYQKTAFDKEISIDVTKSDILILKKDLEQRELELSNLYSTITHFDKEKETYRKKLEEEFDRQTEMFRKRMDDDVGKMEAVWGSKYNQQNEKIKELEMKVQDESLLRQKAEVDLNNFLKQGTVKNEGDSKDDEILALMSQIKLLESQNVVVDRFVQVDHQENLKTLSDVLDDISLLLTPIRSNGVSSMTKNSLGENDWNVASIVDRSIAVIHDLKMLILDLNENIDVSDHY